MSDKKEAHAIVTPTGLDTVSRPALSRSASSTLRADAGWNLTEHLDTMIGRK